MRWWRRVWWLLVLAAVGLWAQPTRALDAAERLPLVQVALWPEFDRPDMLVMYIIHLPEDVSLPTEILWRIPARVEAPSAVAVRTAEGRLLNAEYRVEADPTEPQKWKAIVVTATESIVQIEYYDPALRRDGAERHFDYQWPGHWAVDNLTVEVQHPLKGVAIEISPEPTRVETREDTLRYYLLEMGPVEVGQDVQVSITYQNPTGELTAPPQQMRVNEQDEALTTEAEPSTPQPIKPIFVWLLAIVGVLLLGLAVALYWYSPRQELSTRPPRTSRRRGPKTAPPPVATEEVRYCPQCGTRARPGDRYCRMCGTPLR